MYVLAWCKTCGGEVSVYVNLDVVPSLGKQAEYGVCCPKCRTVDRVLVLVRKAGSRGHVLKTKQKPKEPM